MPIRFRCAYCNQLMGIARRKAGAVVKCPKCAGDIIVPGSEDPEPSAEGVELTGTGEAEPSIVESTNGGGEAVTATMAPASGRAPPPEPLEPRRLGVFLSIGSLAVSVVVVILLLILMFVLGLIIGRQTVTPAEKSASRLIGAVSTV